MTVIPGREKKKKDQKKDRKGDIENKNHCWRSKSRSKHVERLKRILFVMTKHNMLFMIVIINSVLCNLSCVWTSMIEVSTLSRRNKEMNTVVSRSQELGSSSSWASSEDIYMPFSACFIPRHLLTIIIALRPQKRGCLLGTGTVGGGGSEGGKRAREWRLDRGYRPKKTGETVDRRQNNESVKAASPRHCPATSAPCNCCFNCRAGQSHKDNVRCTAVEEQLEAKDVQLSQPSSTSLLVISSGLTWWSSSSCLLLVSPGTLSVSVVICY